MQPSESVPSPLLGAAGLCAREACPSPRPPVPASSSPQPHRLLGTGDFGNWVARWYRIALNRLARALPPGASLGRDSSGQDEETLLWFKMKE